MMKTIAFLYAAAVSAALTSMPLQADPQQIAVANEVAPAYPASALRHRHTGWAVVKYSVNKKGRAENIIVTSSEPARVFDRAAKKAIRQSRFEVPMVDGAPGTVDNQYRKFVFEIDEQVPGDVVSRRGQ